MTSVANPGMSLMLGGREQEMKTEAKGLLCAGTVLSTFTLTPNYSLKPSKGTAIVLL